MPKTYIHKLVYVCTFIEYFTICMIINKNWSHQHPTMDTTMPHIKSLSYMWIDYFWVISNISCEKLYIILSLMYENGIVFVYNRILSTLTNASNTSLLFPWQKKVPIFLMSLHYVLVMLVCLPVLLFAC